MTGIRIIAAVLDTQQLILYKEDGSTVTVPQGDARVRPILDQITPILNAGGVATITLEHFNSYAAFEKKTNGFVKLFRVAKRAVAHLFGSDEDREDVSSAPAGGTAETIAPMKVGKVPTVASAIDEIMAHATSVNSPQFQESDSSSEHTMVAVVGEGPQAKVVPGVEALKDQFHHAAKLGSTVGVENLIRRLGIVIANGNRGHSVQDVLRFLEKGDLPVADDGSIVAYKILRRHPTLKDTFVDCHTRKIPQKVGSYVRVDESLVDRNRRNECSNGLHIARRGYLGSFSGDVCVLTKIDPEDVVTVPHGDPNKVRVCGYHILGVIPDGEFTTLRSNRPMTENSTCQRLLGQAISGQHVARLEEVLVTKQQGEGVKITQLLAGSAPTPSLASAPTAVALDDKTVKDPEIKPVDPKTVAQKSQVEKAQAAPKVTATKTTTTREPNPKGVQTGGSRTQVALALATEMEKGELFSTRQDAARKLLELKKKTKVSWTTLGLSERIGKDAAELAVAKPIPLKQEMTPPPVNIPAKAEEKPKTRQQRARYLADVMMTGRSVPARERAAKDLKALKKETKVGYAALGLSDAEIKEVEYLTSPKTS